MAPDLTARHEWEIDRILAGLIGEEVRVAAKSFSPMRWTGESRFDFVAVRSLYLPDNSQPTSLPVFFEGRLECFAREVGVVLACIGASRCAEGAVDGSIYFRGSTAVLLRGPAIVELASPFHVERLPVDADNYWRDIRMPSVQFELPFSRVQSERVDVNHNP